MEGFLDRQPLGGYRCEHCGADTHEPEAHREGCAATWRHRAEVAEAGFERLRKAILDASSESVDCCPFCDLDTRPLYDCKNCQIDHLGGRCYRDGHHALDCIWDELNTAGKGE
jgi:hypothetical protein